MRRGSIVLAAALAAPLLAGCARFSYRPHPLSEEESAASLRRRSLDDAGVQAFLEEKLGQPLAEWPLSSWDLSTLTLVALYHHATIPVACARVEVAEAGAITAGARPNPGLKLAPGWTDSPGSPWLLALGLTLPIETAGKRRHRVERASHLAEVSRLRLAEAVWQVRSAVRKALLAHEVAQRRLALLGKEEESVAERVALLERRFQVGAIPRPELDDARADLAHLGLAVRAAAGHVQVNRAGLASAVGVPAAALEGRAIGWPDFEALPGAEAVSAPRIQAAAVLNRLDVRTALAEYAAAEADLRLEAAKQVPDFQLGPGYDYDGGSNKFSIGLSMTLPLFNRNQGPIAEAEARRKLAEQQFRATQARAIGAADQALAAYRAAIEDLDVAGEVQTIEARREESARRAFKAGETDRLKLTEVRIAVVRGARARLEALHQVQTALGGLEDAVERPLGVEQADAASVGDCLVGSLRERRP